MTKDVTTLTFHGGLKGRGYRRCLGETCVPPCKLAHQEWL